MSTEHIIRAWKDPEYRMSLSEAERAELPPHPAGLMELADSQLGEVGGAAGTLISWIFGSCTCEPDTCCNSLCSVNVTCPGRSTVPSTVQS